MAIFYKMQDQKLDRPVTLNLLAAQLPSDDDAKARFLREARAAAGLPHPNICPVHEISELRTRQRTRISTAAIVPEDAVRITSVGISRKIPPGTKLSF